MSIICSASCAGGDELPSLGHVSQQTHRQAGPNMGLSLQWGVINLPPPEQNLLIGDTDNHVSDTLQINMCLILLIWNSWKHAAISMLATGPWSRLAEAIFQPKRGFIFYNKTFWNSGWTRYKHKIRPNPIIMWIWNSHSFFFSSSPFISPFSV